MRWIKTRMFHWRDSLPSLLCMSNGWIWMRWMMDDGCAECGHHQSSECCWWKSKKIPRGDIFGGKVCGLRLRLRATLVRGAEIMLITCRLKILDFRANDKSYLPLLVSASCFLAVSPFKNEQWPSPLLPYPLGTQIRKWEGTRQHPISSIGRLDAFASADVHSHFNIEGATNHFPPRTGVKMPSSLLRYPLGTQGW